LDSDLVYPQGCALGFDLDVQVKIMRTVEGLENVEVTQPGFFLKNFFEIFKFFENFGKFFLRIFLKIFF